MKLEGPRVGFHRKIREPTINRPGLALSGFFSYFAEKRVQVLGAAESTYLKSLASEMRVKRFQGLCEQKIPVHRRLARNASGSRAARRRRGSNRSRYFGRR